MCAPRPTAHHLEPAWRGSVTDDRKLTSPRVSRPYTGSWVVPGGGVLSLVIQDKLGTHSEGNSRVCVVCGEETWK